MFSDLLDEEEDGANYVLNKIQGALGHGGGIQVAAGTDEYADMKRFLSLLGEDLWIRSPLRPDTLFDGVTMESPQKHAEPGGHCLCRENADSGGIRLNRDRWVDEGLRENHPRV